MFSGSVASYNVVIGNEAAESLDGSRSVIIGANAGHQANNTTEQTMIGNRTGYFNQGDANVFIGYDAGSYNSTGFNNTFIGHLSGYINNSGVNNTFLGKNSGRYNTIESGNTFLGSHSGWQSVGDENTFVGVSAGAFNLGDRNVFMGYTAGLQNSEGTDNIYIGHESGKNGSAGSENIMIGSQAGLANVTGEHNVFIGYQAGTANTASNNTFLGFQAGRDNSDGNINTFIGRSAGAQNKTGDFNTFVGYQAGESNVSGNSNTYVGYNAGGNSIGSGNVFIGNAAGLNGGSDQLMIDNNATSAPMIHGHFDRDFLKLNAFVRIQDGALPPNVTSGEGMELFYDNILDVGKIQVFDRGIGQWGTLDLGVHVVTNGIPSPPSHSFAMPNVIGLGSAIARDWDTYSDARIKSNIKPINNGLNLINKLNPVTYFQHDATQNEHGFEIMTDGQQTIGLVAQEVYHVLPEVVNKPIDEQKELWSMNYEKIIPFLIKAVQELSEEVDTLKSKLGKD